MEKRRQKELLTTWKCLNFKKSSQQLPSCLIATEPDSLFCFRHYSEFEQEKTLKNFSQKLYTSKIKKKRIRETKSSAWDLKNAHTSTNPRTVKRYEAGMCIGLFFIFFDQCIKQIDSMLPWVCSITDNRGRQKVVKTSVCWLGVLF